jgi:protein-S-isoprenylcysteine O-methyltransferase Ste14
VPTISLKHRNFAANLALLWLAILFYSENRFYLSFLNARYTLDLGGMLGIAITLVLRTQGILLWFAIAYTIGGCVYYWRKSPTQPSHAYVAIQAGWRWLKLARSCLAKFPQTPALPADAISRQEKVSLLFLLLKFIYLPMMVEFMLANWSMLAGRWWSYSGVMRLPRLVAFNDFVFPCLIDVFFITECALYAFGYAFESRRCRNVVRSVEPTVFGWAVTLACYPPFNGFLNNYVSWYTSDNPEFKHDWATGAAKCAILACFLVYLWGAISLGTKCSNLTNRGIVTKGAFAWVRHPAYAAKNLAWWIALLPALSLPAFLSMAFWSLLYFLRAVTEERHLSSDPDYLAYCQQVRYRFIPGVF